MSTNDFFFSECEADTIIFRSQMLRWQEKRSGNIASYEKIAKYPTWKVRHFRCDRPAGGKSNCSWVVSYCKSMYSKDLHVANTARRAHFSGRRADCESEADVDRLWTSTRGVNKDTDR